ncbi:MAG: DNA translocase FtsK 4TM domain-containing protein, partial [Anaerolineales bacterium]|nr:DNA translocase FtsK 4TM domain-containing protein [Anaerolineales bacterium]
MPLIKLPNFLNKKPAGKTLSSKKRDKPAPKGKPQPAPAPAPQQQPQPTQLSWWDQLSGERKLDVIGVMLTFVGVIIFLGLLSTARSKLIGGSIFFLTQIFGWGVYILPLGLLVFGLWLIFRKIERIPPLSLERVVGSAILFVWLLTVLHALVSTADTAEAVALTGVGGGALGGVFQRMLWYSLGGGGAFIALIAWLVIGVAVLLDKPVPELFRWLLPIFALLRKWLAKHLADSTPSNARLDSLQTDSAPEDDLTPIDPAVGVPQVTRTVTGPAVIEWKLPNIADILDAGNAPAFNEDFIQARARLIEETLASFGAPAQVVAISRG